MPFQKTSSGAARLIVVAAVAAAAASMTSCGSDGGISADLPPGPSTTAPPGDIVLYAAMADGDRIDAFRLGTDGLLPSEPFDTIFVPEPRRLTIADGVLFATLADSIVSMELGPEGELPSRPSSRSLIDEDYNPVDLEVQDNILYVAAAGLGRVQSFELDDDGDIPLLPTGSGAGDIPTDYTSLAINGRLLYSGSRDLQAIDIFLLKEDGNVFAIAEQQDPVDRIALPDDLEIRDGILYVTSASDRSVRAYRIQLNGLLPTDEDSRTKSEEYYSDIMLDGHTLYAAAYNAGRIDLYTIDDNGMLPEEPPFRRTQDDPASYPAHLLMNDGILYVAQAGLDRVDAYVLDSSGLPPVYPSSSTNPAPSGRSYPLNLALFQLQ